MLIETGILAPENSVQELQERTQGTITVKKLTNIMLWVAAISFLMNIDNEAAYLAVIENHVEWPKSDVQRIWTAYEEVCSASRDIMESTLRTQWLIWKSANGFSSRCGKIGGGTTGKPGTPGRMDTSQREPPQVRQKCGCVMLQIGKTIPEFQGEAARSVKIELKAFKHVEMLKKMGGERRVVEKMFQLVGTAPSHPQVNCKRIQKRCIEASKELSSRLHVHTLQGHMRKRPEGDGLDGIECRRGWEGCHSLVEPQSDQLWQEAEKSELSRREHVKEVQPQNKFRDSAPRGRKDEGQVGIVEGHEDREGSGKSGRAQVWCALELWRKNPKLMGHTVKCSEERKNCVMLHIGDILNGGQRQCGRSSNPPPSNVKILWGMTRTKVEVGPQGWDGEGCLGPLLRHLEDGCQGGMQDTLPNKGHYFKCESGPRRGQSGVLHMSG
ncbi:hypothetical protein B0H14DRAFT_2615515 [Mycena olivaceomarginata]|nr:hypothetical protein B0H14DRAFT_2615515 [Mycena olivaceomarginata]